MKKVLTLLIASVLTVTAASAQALNIGNKQDTARGNATKVQTIKVASQAGLTVQVAIDHVTDTATGVVSLWGSITGDVDDYCPLPGADSVTITFDKGVRKMWYVIPSTIIGTKANPILYLQVRTRLASNTTNASSKVYVRSRLLKY